MTLPEKITLCRLEEDNPQKSYFRIRPLYVVEAEALEKVENVTALYPDEGGIRIVPDKNEALRFKNRMRTLGGFCLLDLIRHAGENDKIRPNKNYSPERGECNRNIVYSDVITPCPDYTVMQVITPETDSAGAFTLRGDAAVLTRHVILCLDGKLSGPFIPERAGEMSAYSFTPDSARAPMELSPDSLIETEADGEKISLFFDVSALRSKYQRRPAPVEAAKPREAEPEPAAAPAEAVTAPEVPAAEDRPAAKESAPVPAEPAPAAAPAEKAAPEQPKKPEPKRAPEAEAKPAPQEREPRRPAVFDGQLGLNPRRSKSLYEIVDEGWRHSRIEQLGAEVVSDAHSEPVVSPIEKAASALKDAWQLEEGRAALVSELVKLDSLPEAVAQLGGIKPAPSQGRDEAMDALEAERLSLMREIDTLKNDRVRRRAELMEETRAAHEKEIAAMETERSRLKSECESNLRAARAAKAAQEEAEKLLSSQSRDKLDSEFLKYAMFTRAAKMIEAGDMDMCEGYSALPQTEERTAAQMISDLRKAFEACGRELDHDEALNLLACLALGRIVLVSGPAGSGKTFTCDMLAGALGLTQEGALRYARVPSGTRNASKHPAFRELNRANDKTTQRFVLLDDINALPVPDQAQGLLPFSDSAPEEGFTLLMTCQDDQVGYPLQTRVLDRAFFIRLKQSAPCVWGSSLTLPKAGKAATLESVRRAFAGKTEVPTEIKARFALLTEKLSKHGVHISPRAQADMYAYCAAVIPLMTGEPIQALDRAFAQRAMPCVMATAKPEAVRQLPEVLCDMPLSVALLNEPIALPPMC